MRIYLDTSLYLPFLLGQDEAKPFRKVLGEAQAVSSTLLVMETERNLVRLCREQLLSEQDFSSAMSRLRADSSVITLRDFSLDLCLNSQYPAVRIPRSSDLIHLRTALWFQENGGVDRFLCLDRNLRLAAEEVGLPVTSV